MTALHLETDVVYGVADGIELTLDIVRPAGTNLPLMPLVIVHGGGWFMGSKENLRPFAERLAAHGIASFCISYRLVTPGIIYPAPLDDVQRAVRWVRAHAGQFGADGSRVGALGLSAGGHLVALLGTHDTRDNSDPQIAAFSSRPECVIDYCGPTDFMVPLPDANNHASLDIDQLVVNLMGAPRASASDFYRAASPLYAIDRATVPFLILHGVQDDIVPLDQSQRFHAALRDAGIESTLIEFPEEGHSPVLPATWDRWESETVGFLKRHLVA